MKRERGRPKKVLTGDEPEVTAIGIKLNKQLWLDFKMVVTLQNLSGTAATTATGVIENLISGYVQKNMRYLTAIQKVKSATKKKK